MLLPAKLLFLLSLVGAPASAVWPVPQSISTGTSSLWLSETIKVTYNGQVVRNPSCPVFECSIHAESLFKMQMPYTYGYEPVYLNSYQVVQAGVSRALGAIFSSSIVPWKLHKRNELASFEPPLHGSNSFLWSLQITQTGKDSTNTYKPLAGQVDESYNLTIGTSGTAQISAVSSVGILRGLESFVHSSISTPKGLSGTLRMCLLISWTRQDSRIGVCCSMLLATGIRWMTSSGQLTRLRGISSTDSTST